MSEIISFEETFQRLRQSYVERLKNSIEAIDNVLAQKQLGPLSQEDLKRALSLFHGLAGSGTTFGFPQVSEGALKIEIYLDLISGSLPEYEVMNDRDFQTFEAMAMEFRKTCARGIEMSGNKPTIAATTPSAEKTADRYSVLLVDDDQELSDFLAAKLKEKGIHTETVRNGDTALKILSLKKPDLVILDIMMPGMDGHEMLRRLKQDPEFVTLPVIMLTGKAGDRDVTNAKHSGAMDYIVKPVDPEQLVNKVMTILDSVRNTILIADNDLFIVQLLESKFKNEGYKVLTADNGIKAWNLVYKEKPSLVILDILMPGMDGLSVMQNMQSNQATKNIPVIVVSTRNGQEQITEGYEAGATEYITKPIISDDVLDRARQLLKKKSAGV